MKKLIAIGIIILFIGVAVAPSINSSVVKTSDDLVTLTSQACGIQGFGNTTVKLTKEQYHNLEQYLVEFRARLNQTITRDEAVPIFKDAVVELNKYGLLPSGMNITQAQELVTRQYNTASHQLSQQLNFSGPLKPYNFMALIAGQVRSNFMINLILDGGLFIVFIILLYIIGSPLYLLLYLISPYLTDSILLQLAAWIIFDNHYYLSKIADLLYTLTQRFPISIINNIRFKNSSGWVFSLGFLGIKKYNGNLSGLLPPGDLIYGPGWKHTFAIMGFTGIKISLGDPLNHFFLGTAFSVGIEQN